MVRSAIPSLPLADIDLLVIENVGNLVCPAEFRVGEDARIMVCSVTEGEDKPLKYPLMFRACELVVVNKIDLLEHLDFDVDRLEANLDAVHPGVERMRVSARTGEGVGAVPRLARARDGESGRRRVSHPATAPRVEERLRERAEANERFFAAEADRIARLCHRMAERFAADGRLVAFAATPAARSDARHVAVEFVHPVIVGKRALPALALAGEGGDAAAQVDVICEPGDIALGFGPGVGAAMAARARARLPDRRLHARVGSRVGARAADARSVGRAGARRDALPRAVGARARVLRPPRAARGPDGAPGARHGRVELPLSVPRPSRRPTSRRSSPTSGAPC